MSHWNIKFAWWVPWFPLFFLVLVGAGTVDASTLAFGASTPLGLPESSEPLSFLRCCFLSLALTLVSHVPGGQMQNQMVEWPDVCKRMIQTIFHLWLLIKKVKKKNKWWTSSPEYKPKLIGTLCEAKQNWKMYCVIPLPWVVSYHHQVLFRHVWTHAGLVLHLSWFSSWSFSPALEPAPPSHVSIEISEG